MPRFTFELVFTGMCLLELDQEPTACTVHIPDAACPEDVFASLPVEKRPFRHVPRLSFPTKFQVSGGGGFMRPVNWVFPAPDGEEIGVCKLEGETLSLEPPTGSPGLSLSTVTKEEVLLRPRAEELFDWTSSLQDLLTLSGCTFTGIDSSAVTARVLLRHGQLGTLECGRQNDGIVVYEYDQVRGNPKAKPGRSLADAVVLRLEGLENEVILRSSAGDFYFFARNLAAREVVRVCISNFHEQPQDPDNGLFDFLWYYHALEGLEALGKPPDPLDLFIPYIPLSIQGGPVTGSSGHCPPTTVVTGTGTGKSKSKAKDFAVPNAPITAEGEATKAEEFPSSVALLNRNGQLVGSGVLLDGDIVLSAGHVLEHRPMKIVVGNSVDAGQRYELGPSATFKRPGGFRGGILQDDLLLCPLKTAIDAGAPARATTAEIDGASTVTVVGFGFGDRSGREGIQRKTPPLKVRHAACPSGDPSGCHVGKELVTDETGFGGVYSRDSGAPLYVESGEILKLAAITSRTTTHEQGIYVRLDAYADWIAEAIAEIRALPASSPERPSASGEAQFST